MASSLRLEKWILPPISAIVNFSCQKTLAIIEANIGVVKFSTTDWEKGNLWMLKNNTTPCYYSSLYLMKFSRSICPQVLTELSMVRLAESNRYYRKEQQVGKWWRVLYLNPSPDQETFDYIKLQTMTNWTSKNITHKRNFVNVEVLVTGD